MRRPNSAKVPQNLEVNAMREVELSVLDIWASARAARSREDLKGVAVADVRRGHQRQLHAQAPGRRRLPFQKRPHIGLQLDGLDEIEAVVGASKLAIEVDTGVELQTRQVLAEGDVPVVRVRSGNLARLVG